LYRKYLLARWLDYQGKQIIRMRGKSRQHEKAFRLILETRAGLGKIVKSLVLDCKCIVDCGSTCCYFPGRRGLGVFLSEEEAEKVCSILEKMGLRREDYVRALDKGGKKPHFARLNKRRRIPEVVLARSPKLLSDERLWVNKNSYACMFLKEDNACLLYDRLRPRSCATFICKTGSMVNALFLLGVIRPSYLDGRKISEINTLADRATTLFSDEGMFELDHKIAVCFMDLVKLYLKSGKGLSGKMKELLELGLEYDLRRNRILRGIMP